MDKVDFLHLDKHQNFLQVDTIGFGGRTQAKTKSKKGGEEFCFKHKALE